MKFVNFDATQGFQALKGAKKPSLKEIVTEEHIKNCSIGLGGGLTFNYAARGVDKNLVEIFQNIVKEQELIEKYKELLSGERVNTGEDRKVLHHLTRGKLNGDVKDDDGTDLFAFYQEQLHRMEEFANNVHGGHTVGSTGKAFDTVVQIGIGGSDLGPRALYIALENVVENKLKAHFISNVDPDDPNSVLAKVNPETTLFVLVSKSGTTQETLTNQEFVLEWLKSRKIKGMNPAKHFVAVTSATSPLANNPDYLDSFYIDDYIGGRYSSTSAVGGVVLSLAYGPSVFKEILEGATETDKMALESDITKNAPLMDALIGVYERNIKGMPCTAILPYSQALSRFPAHLQQLDMESNGKQVSRDDKPINYETGPIIFGEPGTNGQHSFYQLLHQGTTPVPLQFIGFTSPQINNDITYEGSSSQKKLNANLAAQIVAFGLGRSSDTPSKNFPGERPSSVIHGKQLTPKSLGSLLAHFENKVMFQGFVWNINSFDQEGVQLGKILANELLSGKGSPILQTYANILG